MPFYFLLWESITGLFFLLPAMSSVLFCRVSMETVGPIKGIDTYVTMAAAAISVESNS